MAKENRRQDISLEQQRETQRRAYAEALSLRERFRGLEQLTIDMTFEDLKLLGTYSPQMRSFGAAAKAFFAFGCPRTLCFQGGFDLDPIIQSLFDSDRAKSSGTLECRGWLQPSRSDNARCRLHLHYTLQLQYESPESIRVRRRTRT